MQTSKQKVQQLIINAVPAFRIDVGITIPFTYLNQGL